MMTASWNRGTLATLIGAVVLAACSSSDSGDLFDPSPGGRGSGGAAGSGQSGAGASDMGTGGMLGGVGGTLARGGAAGASSGGVAGESGGTGGKVTGGNGGGATTTGGASGAGGAVAGGSGGGSAKGGSGGATGGGATKGGSGGATSGGSGGTGGKAATGGSAGKASGGATSGGAGGDGGDGGDGGGSQCASGFIPSGTACVRPKSCAELHRAEPDLPSAAYALKPATAASEFQAYCEMVAEGGGFTLVLNQGPAFDPSVLGNEKALGYQANGVNRSYSEVLLESDVMLDMAEEAISGASYELRAVISGVHTGTRGHTVRDLINDGPHYLERENNSNLVVRTSGNRSCTDILANDIASLVCSSCNGNNCNVPVLVFGDGDRCSSGEPAFAIGGAESYSKGWGNCAGWPQNPNPGVNHYPDNFRIWIR